MLSPPEAACPILLLALAAGDRLFALESELFGLSCAPLLEPHALSGEDAWCAAGAPACLGKMHAAHVVDSCLDLQLLVFVLVVGIVGGIGYIDFGAGLKRTFAPKAARSMPSAFRTGYGSARDASDAPKHQHPQRARRARVLGSIAARCAAERREQREQAALQLARAHHRRLLPPRTAPHVRRGG